MPNNPYLYNRDQKDLQTLQSVLGLMDYFGKRKELKRTEEAIGSLSPGLQNYFRVTGKIPDKPDALTKLYNIVMPEEEPKPETLEQKRIRFGDLGQVPIDQEFQQETGFQPTTGPTGLGFTPTRPLDVQSSIEGVNRLKKQGLQFTGQTPTLRIPEKPSTVNLSDPEQDIYSYQADQKKLGRNIPFHQAKTELAKQREGAKKSTEPWDAQTYRNELVAWQLKNPGVSPGEFFRGSRQSNPEEADNVASEVLGIPKQNIQKFLRFKTVEDFEKSLKSAPLSDTEKEFLRHQAEVWWGR